MACAGKAREGLVRKVSVQALRIEVKGEELP